MGLRQSVGRHWAISTALASVVFVAIVAVAPLENDPMWQMLESGDLIELMEQHQQNIDRMLGR